MHFALPPRKTSQPPPYARPALRPHATARRRQLQLLGYAVLGSLTLYLVLSWLLKGGSATKDSGEIEPNQEVVIVTVFDDEVMSKDYIRMVKANRDDYAQRYGYVNFYTNTSTYSPLLTTSGDATTYNPIPTSWSIVPAMRHVLKLHPSANYIWLLSPLALITNPSLSLSSHIFSNLTNLMQKDVPVVPPDSVIHTFSHLKPSHAHLILTQDVDNLGHTNLIVKNSPPTPTNTDNWAHYFLDAWFDPLYRAYAFQKAENHALEHIVQWHPTILAKLVLIPQRTMNSYNYATPAVKDNGGATKERDTMWKENDFVINLKGCDDDLREEQKTGQRKKEGQGNGRDCEKEMKVFYEVWQQAVEKLDAAGKEKV